jgi:hypothetical protein
MDLQHLLKERRVSETQDFNADCRTLSKQFKRFPHVLQGIYYGMKRAAHVNATLIPGTNVYRKRTRALYDIPRLVVYYSFDEDEVRLYAIEIAESEGNS